MFVCLLVCGGLMEIQTLTQILIRFCKHLPTCPRKVLAQFDPGHLTPWVCGALNSKSFSAHF